MVKFLRLLEFSEEIGIDIDELISTCTLLDIPASSRISWLSHEHVEKLIEYYKTK